MKLFKAAALIAALCCSSAYGEEFDPSYYDKAYIKGTHREVVTVSGDDGVKKTFVSWSSSKWAIVKKKDGKIIGVETREGSQLVKPSSSE